MSHIYIPTSSAEDWRRLLAEPATQWRKGYSARELAECWERSEGLPTRVKALLATSPAPALRELTVLLAIPEFKVDLPPQGGRASQNDLFVLARATGGELTVIMVEGKVAESFGPLLGDWLVDGTPGKQERYSFLLEQLGFKANPPASIRYQLLHRTVSAILTAREFNAQYAILLVHSFSREHAGWSDFQAFLGLYDVSADLGELVAIPGHDHPRLFAGWVSDYPSSTLPAREEE